MFRCDRDRTLSSTSLSQRETKDKAARLFRVRPPLVFFANASAGSVALLCGHLFLFAFHAHCFELALFGVVRFLNLGLDAVPLIT